MPEGKYLNENWDYLPTEGNIIPLQHRFSKPKLEHMLGFCMNACPVMVALHKTSAPVVFFMWKLIDLYKLNNQYSFYNGLSITHNLVLFGVRNFWL